MRIHVLVPTLAAIAVAGACQRPAAVATTRTIPLNAFSVVIEHSSAGWQVQCESGCEWMKVSMSCAGCSVQLDATGIVRAVRARAAPIGFAFVLIDDGVGKWTARGIQGTAWKKLTWTCNNALCRARLDTEGVGPA
jgi:hypothetical protein